jgi:hypothetical protein
MFGREPALIIGAIQAIVALGIGFGLHVTPEQFGLIMAAVTALLAVLTRSQTVSNPQSDALIKTAVEMPTNTPVEVVKSVQAEKDAQ